MKTVEHTGEMQFGRSDNIHELNAETFSDGEVCIEVSDDVESFGYVLTLGQAIQLRDFLNRHIDELALKQTGSLAVRSSDDSTQLAAVEDVQAVDEERLEPGQWYWACPIFDVDDDTPYDEQTKAVPARYLGDEKWEWPGVEGDHWPCNGLVYGKVTAGPLV